MSIVAVNLNYTFKITLKAINYIPVSQWHSFHDSPYSHFSVSQAYYILSKESTFEDEYDRIN